MTNTVQWIVRYAVCVYQSARSGQILNISRNKVNGGNRVYIQRNRFPSMDVRMYLVPIHRLIPDDRPDGRLTVTGTSYAALGVDSIFV